MMVLEYKKAPMLGSFKLQTFKDVDLCSQV